MFDRSSELIPIILRFVDGEFSRLHPRTSIDLIKDRRLLFQSLRIAETNGLLYPFCCGLLGEPFLKDDFGMIEAYVKNEENTLSLLRKTLQSVKVLFEEESLDFMFIKLYRGMEYAPKDVDVLVKSEDMQTAISMLKRDGFGVEVLSDVEIKCQKAGILRVDLYSGFYYLSWPFIDENSFWEDTRKVDIQGVNCSIPSLEVDFLSLIIHSLLGHRRLSLLDFLYAKSLMRSERFNFHKIMSRAEERGWGNAFEKAFQILSDLYQSLYLGADCPNGIRFPLVFSTKFTLGAFNGFACFPVKRTKKIFFIISAFLDATYHSYLSAWQVVPIEIPTPLKVAISRSLYKVREYRGDRKAMDGK